MFPWNKLPTTNIADLCKTVWCWAADWLFGAHLTMFLTRNQWCCSTVRGRRAKVAGFCGKSWMYRQRIGGDQKMDTLKNLRKLSVVCLRPTFCWPQLPFKFFAFYAFSFCGTVFRKKHKMVGGGLRRAQRRPETSKEFVSCGFFLQPKKFWGTLQKPRILGASFFYSDWQWGNQQSTAFWVREDACLFAWNKDPLKSLECF